MECEFEEEYRVYCDGSQLGRIFVEDKLWRFRPLDGIELSHQEMYAIAVKVEFLIKREDQ